MCPTALIGFGFRHPMDQPLLTTQVLLPPNPSCMLILAHGSATALTSPHLECLSQSLFDQGVATLRFNFRYRDRGAAFPRSVGESTSDYLDALTLGLDTVPDLDIWLSGHSYGGRIASHLLADLDFRQPSSLVDARLQGVIAYSLPIHPAGKPSLNRWDHLRQLKRPLLFFSGERDVMAKAALAERLCETFSTCQWRAIPGADHGFKQTQRTRSRRESVYDRVARETLDFISKT